MEYVITWGRSFWAVPKLGIPAETGTKPQELKGRKTERETGCTYSFHAPCSYCGSLAAQA